MKGMKTLPMFLPRQLATRDHEITRPIRRPGLARRATTISSGNSSGVVAELGGDAPCEEIFDGVSGPFGASLRARVGGQV